MTHLLSGHLLQTMRSGPESDLTWWELDVFLTSSCRCSEVLRRKCMRSETRLFPSPRLSFLSDFPPAPHSLISVSQYKPVHLLCSLVSFVPFVIHWLSWFFFQFVELRLLSFFIKASLIQFSIPIPLVPVAHQCGSWHSFMCCHWLCIWTTNSLPNGVRFWDSVTQ